MADLAAFLAARLDEDEAAAKAAASVAGPDWKAETYWPEDESRTRTCVRSVDGAVLGEFDDTPDYPDMAAHAARHDPARVLREVAAKRAILAAVQAIPHSYIEDCYYSCELAVDPGDPEQRPGSGYCNDNAIRTGGCTCGLDALAARLLGPLAAIYSDHPDYDPAWDPGLGRACPECSAPAGEDCRGFGRCPAR